MPYRDDEPKDPPPPLEMSAEEFGRVRRFLGSDGTDAEGCERLLAEILACMREQADLLRRVDSKLDSIIRRGGPTGGA